MNADEKKADEKEAIEGETDEETAKVAEEEAAKDENAPVATEQDLVGIGDNDAIFEALWKRVLEAWDDDKPHQALLEHALKNEQLPELAGRYRALKDDPEKGARAEKKINGIVLAATQMLMSMKTPTRTKTPWQWTVAAVMTFAIVCAWLIYKLVIPHRI